MQIITVTFFFFHILFKNTMSAGLIQFSRHRRQARRQRNVENYEFVSKITQISAILQNSPQDPNHQKKKL